MVDAVSRLIIRRSQHHRPNLLQSRAPAIILGIPAQSAERIIQNCVRPRSTRSGVSGARTEMAQIQPLGDRVVVLPSAREETSRGGIFLPDTAKEKPQEG